MEWMCAVHTVHFANWVNRTVNTADLTVNTQRELDTHRLQLKYKTNEKCFLPFREVFVILLLLFVIRFPGILHVAVNVCSAERIWNRDIHYSHTWSLRIVYHRCHIRYTKPMKATDTLLYKHASVGRVCVRACEREREMHISNHFYSFRFILLAESHFVRHEENGLVWWPICPYSHFPRLLWFVLECRWCRCVCVCTNWAN